MPAFTTEGLILKRVNFGEADRVLTVLTERFGKISVIAKGVRRITSRRAGNVEVLNKVRLHLFKAKSYNLTEAESIETFQKLKANLTLTTYAFHIIELVDRLVPEEQKNPYVYNLALEILTILQANPRQIFIRAFEVKLLSLLGFWSLDGIPNLNPSLEEILDRLQKSSWEEISTLEIKEEVAMELERILRYYIEKILESSLRSVQVLKKLK
jgi:DNA repair protein RecO (recombination protein O)